MLYSNIFGLVVDSNRVDVVVESGPLNYSPTPPPIRGVCRKAETNLLGSKSAWDLLFSLEAEDLQLEAEDV